MKQQANTLNKLIQQIRISPKYQTWRNKVLKQYYPSGRIPRNIQVHHKTRVKNILKKHGITTLKEALNCSELWDIENGVAITRGEHYIISLLERYKHASPAFTQLLHAQAQRLTKTNQKTEHND